LKTFGKPLLIGRARFDAHVTGEDREEEALEAVVLSAPRAKLLAEGEGI
jgi:hypothetical protein